MPTGVALQDPRRQLFDAAVRVLVRDGVTGLTSRAVATEAGVAKGVLHRHFADFDAFLAELVLDRIAHVEAQATALQNAAGTGTVTDNLTRALMTLFEPVMVAIVVLVIARDELRTRLRRAGTARLPLVGEGAAMIAGYLTAEREHGRIASDADVDTLAPTLIGAAHLLFTERKGSSPEPGAVRRVVTAVLASAMR
ncbi:TetR family transcriptional regulator [Micromonospora sp. DR5-3]|uniref:TetR/AcrR family transcriptional regulator n=1 Tax=unclassified Micromonospora TaxID=2617518 RepID=UPI0011D66FEB|nr:MULTISPECIES: TetR/AcrR family transcriptional regulator [unclassified Micromonospora]MCW3820337.1 TetR family transcriptional regulator [Micromonospora sp. DR5-3]TYC19416.1 TetR family transcriptional regulator [Micromonospora sp. MP36]